MTKIPDYYKTPLRSRKDIAAFIFDATHQRIYDHQCHPFCFNVKCHDVDFSFDHLLEVLREMEDDPKYTHNDGWLAITRERFPSTENSLWEWGQEHACSQFVGRGGSNQPDSDCYTHLWDGTSLDIRYSFEGRSGGWLSINKFQGLDFNGHATTDEYWRGVIETAKWDGEEEPIMDYKTVRQLYQLVTMLEHDLRKPHRAVEEGAAWDFFVNVCADIPQPDAKQNKFEFMGKADA